MFQFCVPGTRTSTTTLLDLYTKTSASLCDQDDEMQEHSVLPCVAALHDCGVTTGLGHPATRPKTPSATSNLNTATPSPVCPATSKQTIAKGALFKRVTPLDEIAALGNENQCQMMSPFAPQSPWKSDDYNELSKQDWTQETISPARQRQMFEEIESYTFHRGEQPVQWPCVVWSHQKSSEARPRVGSSPAAPPTPEVSCS